MQSESISERMQEFTHNDFRLGIRRPNPAHIPASLFFGYFIGHVAPQIN
jgi:hypothetical protein